jgi:glycosyltransferase involved in cell wall biosynthesis
MSRAGPLVSVGMPVYNAERTLAAAVEALLAQTLRDLEIIVSDNASTDATPALLADLAARDHRVRVIHQPHNIGANPNYCAVARAARGRYFKWASSNDWCAPPMLERCVAVLEAHPDVVLAFPRTRLFAQSPEQAEDYDDNLDLRAEDPVDRLVALRERISLNNVMNGVIRTAALRRTHLIPPWESADLVLMGHLALLGKFALVPEPLFYRRMEPRSAIRFKTAGEVRRHHHPGGGARSLFPAWRQCVGWQRVVLDAPLSVRQKRRAMDFNARMCWWMSRGALAADVADAARALLRRRAG